MLKQKRIKKGLTQAQLAKKAKINKSYVSRLEKRNPNFSPSLDLIVKLSKTLECCPVEIFIFFTKIECKYFRRKE